MFKTTRKTIGIATLVSMLCVAVAIPAVSAAKTTKKNIKCTVQGDPTAGLDVTGDITCPKPLGKGKQTGKLVLPHANGKWTFKGGAFTKWHTTSALNGSNVTGTISLKGGTGKFKGCTGKGTEAGPLTTAKIIVKMVLTCKK